MLICYKHCGLQISLWPGTCIQVHHHHPAGVQVVPHQGEKLRGGHLEGDGDILVGIHHNHIILLIHYI